MDVYKLDINLNSNFRLDIIYKKYYSYLDKKNTCIQEPYSIIE